MYVQWRNPSQTTDWTELIVPSDTVMFQSPTVELRMFNKYGFGIVFLHIQKLYIKMTKAG